VLVWHQQGYLAKIPAFLNVPGRVAVWIFFGISGYVISYGFIYQRYRVTRWRDMIDYYINRALRIYPLFLFLSAACWLTEKSLHGGVPIPFEAVPAQLLALQWNQNYQLLGVFWTLGIELQFYLLAPVLSLLLLGRSNKWTLIAGVALYAASLFVFNFLNEKNGTSFDSRNLVGALPHFICGMVGCRAVVGVIPQKILGLVSGFLGLMGVSYVSYIYHTESSRFWSCKGILMVDGIILLLIFSHTHFQGSRVTSKWGQFTYWIASSIGVLSYGIYAWHAYGLKYSPFLTQNLWALILASCLAALGTRLFIERPALSLRRVHRSQS